MPAVTVLRLGHRKDRDKRASMHVALVARALGAKKIVFCGDDDPELLERVRKVSKKWGGTFAAEYSPSYRALLKKFKGETVHLTMYGQPFQKIVPQVRGKNVLVVVGSEKVPKEVYYLCRHNLSVTTQPHSEIAALALFLHEFFEGRELNAAFSKALLRITPNPRGKTVQNKAKYK